MARGGIRLFEVATKGTCHLGWGHASRCMSGYRRAGVRRDHGAPEGSRDAVLGDGSPRPARPVRSLREGGRADEGDGLENRWGRKSLQGSNPCPPASWPLGPLTDGVRSDRWTSNGGGTCV